jgi:hypothetical protein
MGLEPTLGQQRMDCIMGYLMGNRVIQVQLKMSGELPGIKAKPVSLLPVAIHARGPTAQIKMDRNGRQGQINNCPCPIDVG